MNLEEIRTNHRPRRIRFYSPYLGGSQVTRLPGLPPAESKALRITTTFETGRPLNFSGLAGNFDGQGISFGILQWNFGRRSLQPLLLEFARNYPRRFDQVFGPQARQMRQVLMAPYQDQMRFARSINNARNRIVEPWATYFGRLGADPEFQKIQLKHTRPRLVRAARYARQFGLRTERGFALMFDNVTQNGPNWLNVKNRAQRIVASRQAFQQRAGRTPNERELLEIIANVVADTVNPRWREDVRRRRMTIVTGRGRVHGHNFDLAREFGLSDAPWEPSRPVPVIVRPRQPRRTTTVPGVRPMPTREQQAFLERVLRTHIALRTRTRGAPPPDLTPAQLARVRGTNVPMRRDAAQAASSLIAAANRDLAAAKRAGDMDALRTTRISATSGYRSSRHQERLWRNYFRDQYYPQTARRRARLPGGPHSAAAVRHMLDYIRWRIAAPGFSNHQAGLAIDLKQYRIPGQRIRNSTAASAVRKWRNSWFFRWLQTNASRFGFHPYEREPWHWVYRQAG